MNEKILIVDDDKNICEILEFNLKNEGFAVTCAHSAEQALGIISQNSFSLILLDVMMGEMSGYKMSEKLRNENINTPIIFITAKDTENDMLTGFSVGGDDYISKPFSIKEIIARIRAVLKRAVYPDDNKVESSKTQSSKLQFASLIIDLQDKTLYIDGEEVALTKTEFEILALLAENTERIYSRPQIMDYVWGDTLVSERTVDVHITRLRKKMGDYHTLITNRSGYGYKFNTSNL